MAFPLFNQGKVRFNMEKVSYITANPKSVETSVSHQVGQAFLQAYRHSHTNDEIREINLYEEEFSTIGNDILNGWGKMHKNGISSSELNVVEQQKINALNTYNYKRYFSNKIIKNVSKKLVIRIHLKERGYE
ncbi:NAD(P)H-dependent oxidoreductase [Priestia aryabhattai]|uniref:NAD(P)H-dependent oxidoreductase n=2 Tax=Priestia aryabhattai TaxID=412384 RepID=UPI003101407D